MSAALQTACIAVACVVAGGTGTCVVLLANGDRERKSRRRQVLARARKGERQDDPSDETNFALRYALRLSADIASGKVVALASRLQGERASDTRFSAWFRKHVAWAGCSERITASGFCEAAIRLALLGALVGALVGLVFSNILAAVLTIIGALLGASMPFTAMQHVIKERTMKAELHLSEMLQVVALGLRSGLSFERSFELYGTYFDNGFARSCTSACRNWTLGLKTREEALEELARSYDCEQLSRVVESMLRSLRFGSPLVSVLDEASAQSRAAYRARLEERVAKAPVKMMLPTGTLILPAMLLLVLGPVLLELIGNF